MNFIITKEQYTAAKAAWKQIPNPTASDIIIYNLLRGFPVDRGFTPFKDTSANKITSNNCNKWNGFNMAVRSAAYRLSRPETTVDAYVKAYPYVKNEKKTSVFDILLGKHPVLDNGLPKYLETRRLEEIARQSTEQLAFHSKFGVELTDELRDILIEATKGKTK